MRSSSQVRSARFRRPVVGWVPTLLVVGAVWITALGLLDAEWVEGDLLFLFAALLGAFLSGALSLSRLSGLWTASILAVAGVLYVGHNLTRVLSPLLAARWDEAGDRLAVLGQRLVSWGTALVGGPTEPNLVAFTFVTALIVWGGAAWAIWIVVRRGQPLLATLPLLVILALSTFLSGGDIWYLLGLVGCITVAMPLAHLSRQEQRWEREGVDYSPEIRLDVWPLALLVAFCIVLLSLLTPEFSIPRAAYSFWELARRPQAVMGDLLYRVFGGVEPEAPPQLPGGPFEGAGGSALEPSLPRSHLLGGNPQLSQQMVMEVCTDMPGPVFDDLGSQGLVGPQTYWRGLTYDSYGGRHWFNGPSFRTTVAPYQPLIASVVTQTESLKQRFLIQERRGPTLFAASEPYEVDQVVQSRRRTVDDLVSLEGASQDYVVHSRLPLATEEQLRTAPAFYPPHIVDRYLELPGTLPGRVRNLASQITAAAATPYDKALAIERYLRQFPYDLRVPSPPPGRDAVDYFLYDAQRGYCDYYASSFVVLARSAGIPARLAVGYATGGYDPESGCYTVVEMDAHSWPEVYYPGYDWISFEPTSPFQPFQRLEEPRSLPESAASILPLPERPWYVALREWWRRIRREWLTYLVAACGLGLSVALALWTRAWRTRQHLLPVQGIALCYTELSSTGQRLGAARRQHDTPAEYQKRLAAAIRARVPRWPWSRERLSVTIGHAEESVRAIVRAYERASYSAHSPERSLRARTDRTWSRLRRQLWWLWFASRTE